jgi:hypothetical protein
LLIALVVATLRKLARRASRSLAGDYMRSRALTASGNNAHMQNASCTLRLQVLVQGPVGPAIPIIATYKARKSDVCFCHAWLKSGLRQTLPSCISRRSAHHFKHFIGWQTLQRSNG